MSYTKPIIDIIGDLISSFQFNTTIYKAVQTGTTWVLNVDNAFYAQKNFTLTIGGHDYLITDVYYAKSSKEVDVITVSDLSDTPQNITIDSFTLYPLYYFYGTLIDANVQISQVPDASNKTPMIFLRVDDTLQETFHDDPEDSHERVSKVKLYFLTQGNIAELDPSLITDRVYPMSRLMQSFIKQMNSTVSVFERWDEDYSTTVYAKFGVYASGRGMQKSVWVDDLSGIGLDISLKILRPQYCCS